jgi:hypothetical protein
MSITVLTSLVVVGADHGGRGEIKGEMHKTRTPVNGQGYSNK